MRRLYIVVLVSFLVQSCAGIPFADVLFPPTNTLAPSATATRTLPPTRTPIPTNTPQPTRTATIVRFPTQDPSLPTATFIPIPIYIGGDTATPVVIVAAATFSDPGVGFLSVSISPNKIYWGACKNNKATIKTTVENPNDVFSVVIFVRSKSAKEEDYTPWSTGDVMSDHRDGTYSYVLEGIAVEGHNHYKDSWVWIQLVAVDAYGREIGRTPIFNESLHLSPCM